MNTRTKTAASTKRGSKASAALELEPKAPQLPQTAAAPAPYAEPVPSIAMNLISAAINRGSSVDEIDKLIGLFERQRADERRQAYYHAMARFKLQFETIYKNDGASYKAKNRSTGDTVEVNYDFATLGHICEAIIQALATHGIVHDWKYDQPSEGPEAGLIITTCYLTHVHGHSNTATVKFPADPTGSKNPLQAVGSAMTYGERYSLLAACGIAVKEQGDDDGRGAGGVGNGTTEEHSTSTQSTTGKRARPKPAAVAASKRQAAAGPSAELLKRARDAAEKGRPAFSEFWKNGASPAERSALAGELDDLERRVKQADKAATQGENFARRMDKATGSGK